MLHSLGVCAKNEDRADFDWPTTGIPNEPPKMRSHWGVTLRLLLIHSSRIAIYSSTDIRRVITNNAVHEKKIIRRTVP